jgi:hypothetical protein
VTDSASPDSDDIDKFDPGLTQRMIGVMVLRNELKSRVSG